MSTYSIPRGSCRHAGMCRHARSETMTRKLGVVVMVAVTLTFAACTSTTSPAVTKAVNVAKTAAAAALKAESAAKAAAAAAEKAAAEAEAAELASAQPCAASQLAIELGRGGVAMGHVGQLVSFKNISAKTCALKGYPGVKMFDATGHPIPTEVADGPDYTVPSLPESLVIITAGSKATFELGYSDATGYGTERCPTSVQVKITPPGANQPITLPWRIQPYGGSTIATLQCGQIAVSPVYAGSGAFSP